MSSYKISNRIIDVNGDLFEIKTYFKESSVKDPVGLKDLFGYDAVFKKEETLYFVNRIEDAQEVIEDNLQPNTQNNL
jgi:hypothetical protein